MSRPILIENARIVDPASNTDQRGAVLLQDGLIVDIALHGPVGVPDDAEVIDAGGLILAPGLIDMRVFTGEPGKEYRETLQSAGEAAAAGDKEKAIELQRAASRALDKAASKGVIHRNQAANKKSALARRVNQL